MSSTTPVACSLTAPELARRLDQLRGGLFSHARETREDADGIAFVFAGGDDRLAEVLEVVALERACCPFLHVRIDVPPLPGEIQLHLGGDANAIQFIRATFCALVPQERMS